MGITGGGRTLVVNLVADTKKFGSGIASAKDDIGGFGGAIKKLGDIAGPALLGAAAAAGAFAAKFAVDGVKAAAEEEKAVRALSGVLDNLGFPNATQQVEDWIGSTQKATGVADNELRPAFQRLVLTTKDVAKAQELTTLAMDISAATGKPLEGVANALAKAYDGNTGALGRLGLGLDAATLKSGDLDSITATLSQRFGGAATENAKTYEGQINRLTQGFDELKEAFGAGFLEGLGNTNSATGDLMDTMSNLEEPLKNVGTELGDVAESLGEVLPKVVDVYNVFKDFQDLKLTPDWVDPFITALETAMDPVRNVLNAAMQLYEVGKKMGWWGDGPAASISRPNSNYNSPNASRNPSTNASDYYNNQYAGKQVNRSAFDKTTMDQPTIIIQAGVGDPVAIAREVDRVLRLSNTRLGA